MKATHIFFISIILIVTGYSYGATIWSEDFADSSGFSVTLGALGNDGIADYFQITDGSNINKTYIATSGNFLAGQDIDDGGWTGSASPSELTWSGINISGYSNLKFIGLFGSVATDEIDASDYLHVDYRIDGGNWVNLIWFENDGTTYNTYFLQDTDFSGTGDGRQLTGTMGSFTNSIGTGSSLDLRFTVAVNSGDEDFAADSFFVIGDASGPDNPTFDDPSAQSSSQIDLSWTKNTAGDNVMVAKNTSDSFGTPAGGTTYSVGNSLGTATIIYNGSGTSYNNTGLDPNVIYYYKSWSVHTGGSPDPEYSSGTATKSATTKDLVAPVAAAADEIGDNGFDANWNSVSDASSYRLDVATNDFPDGAGIADVIISQYVETDSGTAPKGIEIWNVSGSSIDFSSKNLVVKIGVNGGALADAITVSSGTLAAGDVWVIGTSDMSPDTTKAFTFNGNDALQITLDGVVQDTFGTPGQDPGSAWTGNGVSTADQNIQIKSGIYDGDTDGWTDPSIRFETVSTTPSGTGGLAGFGVAPSLEIYYVSGYSNKTVSAVYETVSGLDPNKDYYYRVRAYSATSTSTNSATIEVTTTPEPALFGVIGLALLFIRRK